ncbi:MAG TPA: 2-oxo-4-hydroxy-4-carboxy-5-ureidoimidazoline decarboxylase [Gemmatimonadales bacterium]|jgi:2-oxo-4-hydroxy-4-carboxy-5-ureidoimidazoline decarboxylase|nr:2-oxo-4-hydroxy-4-carboxy-5-ureidoimidazoline decarboxylase [Gemmatimonadales bacterium]
MYERLFEGNTPLVERLRGEGPFATNEEMLARARDILARLSEAEQIVVINAHPRIGEHPDRVRVQSARSFREQGYERDATPPEVFDALRRLNEAYERKFGFRFVVFVNRRSKAALVPVLEARLRRSRDEERATALEELLAIAEDRLRQETS